MHVHFVSFVHFYLVCRPVLRRDCLGPYSYSQVPAVFESVTVGVECPPYPWQDRDLHALTVIRGEGSSRHSDVMEDEKLSQEDDGLLPIHGNLSSCSYRFKDNAKKKAHCVFVPRSFSWSKQTITALVNNTW